MSNNHAYSYLFGLFYEKTEYIFFFYNRVEFQLGSGISITDPSPKQFIHLNILSDSYEQIKNNRKPILDSVHVTNSYDCHDTPVWGCTWRRSGSQFKRFQHRKPWQMSRKQKSIGYHHHHKLGRALCCLCQHSEMNYMWLSRRWMMASII